MSATKTAGTDARVVDGAMIASFMGAEPPKVWRADMNSLASATFEMQQADGLFHVVMTSGGNKENIVAFADKEGATQALQALMAAMMTPTGTTAAGIAAPVAEKKSGGFAGFIKKLLKLAAWLIGLFIIFVLLSMLVMPKLMGVVMPDRGLTKVQQGAPIPADELFGE